MKEKKKKKKGGRGGRTKSEEYTSRTAAVVATEGRCQVVSNMDYRGKRLPELIRPQVLPGHSSTWRKNGQNNLDWLTGWLVHSQTEHYGHLYLPSMPWSANKRSKKKQNSTPGIHKHPICLEKHILTEVLRMNSWRLIKMDQHFISRWFGFLRSIVAT
ncbi:hypothetical protein VTN31DRAFT_3666 [Thermomyces dupontii]|uniref:uncharacterized protein n=1 Tax=Talaromyces thermophilus TaxID=28565 RepID=UPI00374277D8